MKYKKEKIKQRVQWLLKEIDKEIRNPPKEFKQDPYIDVADFILGLKEARFLIKKAFEGVLDEM